MEQTFISAEQLCDAIYKDETPAGTVERVKKLLRTYGIETEEIWMESSVPYCYSIRVNVKGTSFGVNGKGMTREFALASGYGEMMERVQLGYLGSGDTQKDGLYNVVEQQSETVSAKELLEKNRDWYEAMARQLHWATGETVTAEQLLMQYADAEGNVEATPFYNLMTGAKAYIPAALRKAVYNANGCAAGNSVEEALVQAISEIVERNHQLRLMSDEVTLPDVPEETLRSCEAAFKIIEFLRNNGFRVIVKDCSFGTKFPVICVTIVDQTTGKYNTHMGAFPVFEIALERTLTESFQGRNIRNIAHNVNFLSGNKQARDLQQLSIELNKGMGEKLPNLFVGKPSYAFREDLGLEGGNNRELLRACVEYFRDLGLDLLVRDGSCLGFHTYQVLVPGYSEIFSHRLSPKQNDLRYRSYAKQVLRNPAQAKPEEIMGFYLHLKSVGRLHARVSEAHGFMAGASIPAALSPKEDSFFMAAAMACVSYTMGRFADVATQIDKMLAVASGEDTARLICVKRYLSMKLNGWDDGQIRLLLEQFHDTAMVQALYECLAAGGNPMERFALRCDGKCGGDCLLRDRCYKRRVDELANLVNQKTGELKFEDLVAKLQAVMEK